MKIINIFLTKKLIRFYTTQELASAFIGSIILAFAFILCSAIYDSGADIFEKHSPASLWYTYTSITPVKNTFNKGDALKFVTIINRKRSANVRREDTLYCDDVDMSSKLLTQYRPIQGYEYRKKGEYKYNRAYSLHIPVEYHTCWICGNTISLTPLGYKKIFNYCTAKFGVNG